MRCIYMNLFFCVDVSGIWNRSLLELLGGVLQSLHFARE